MCNITREVLSLLISILLGAPDPQVKARKEAARKDEVADNITEEQLQELESEFMKVTKEEEAAA